MSVTIALFKCAVKPGGEGIEIDHGGEEHVASLLLGQAIAGYHS